MGLLSTMHSRLVAVMVAVSVCFLAAAGVILWSMLGMESSLSATAAHSREELVPVLHLEGEVRKAELAGWTASFGIYQGAPSFIRGEYDLAATGVSDAFDEIHAQESEQFAEEAVEIRAAEEHWRLALEGFELGLTGDFPDAFKLADHLGTVGDEIDGVIVALDAAQASALTEQADAVQSAASKKQLALWLAAAALLAGLAVMHAVTRLLWGGAVNAITLLREAAHRLASGEWGHVVDVDSPAELAELAKSFNTMSDRLRQSHTDLEHRALHDQLTGLGNRNLMADRIEHAAATRQAQGRTDAFLVIDLDRFKDVNDTRGHALGDEALIAVTGRLSRCVRDADTVARLGGDEFGVLLEGLDGLAEAVTIAERIVTAMSTPLRLNAAEITITASVGIANAAHVKTSTELISGADLAMYEAKRAGGSTWRVFEEELRTELADRVRLEADLRTAITDNKIDVAYQAVYDLESSQPIGVEALARWNHPSHGAVSPARFVPLAENSGMIAELGWYVLRRACTQAGTWRSHYPHLYSFTVAVNIAAAHLEEAEFVPRVLDIIKSAGIEPANLVLEITETMMIRRGSDARQKLHQLRDQGVSVSIDDFGTGYSSLGQLRDYPADTLKIDREFIDGIDTDTDKQALTRTIIDLGRNLGLPCIAEGIETPEELATLRTLSCEFAQGFLFHKPSPSVETEALLALHIPASARAERA